MSKEYKELISRTKESGGIFDAMLAAQTIDGYLSEEAIEAIAEVFCLTPAHVYEAASFYSMLRFAPQGKVRIEICRGAPCHIAGSAEVISAIEKVLGIEIGGTTPDGRYTFEYIECIGQCQSSPSLLINGKLYTDMTADKITEMLKKGGLEA